MRHSEWKAPDDRVGGLYRRIVRRLGVLSSGPEVGSRG